MLPAWATTRYTTRAVERAKETSRLLRELRESRGRSLRKVAADLGIAPSHLSRLERGEKSPSTSVARRAAEYYGVSDDLVELAQGRVPADVQAILSLHPELLNLLRTKYAAPVNAEDAVNR
ncbi:MAG: helix-turn-helix domain-containing protein [Candidatus Dormibacteria bacterium]